MSCKPRFITAVTALLLLAMSALPAVASDAPNDGMHFGFLAGYHAEDGAELPSSYGNLDPENAFYGIRLGWIENRLGVDATVTYFEDARDGLDFDTVFLDTSVGWNFWRGERATFLVYGGPGWAFMGGDGDYSDDSLTVNAGIGLRAQLGDSFYVRPDIRARWIESTEALSYEAIFGVGWQF